MTDIKKNKNNYIYDKIYFYNRLKSYASHMAIESASGGFTYSQILTLSRQIISYLRDEYKVTSQDIIAIELPRGPAVIVIITACFIYEIPFILINPYWPKKHKEKLISLSTAYLHISILEDYFPNIQKFPHYFKIIQTKHAKERIIKYQTNLETPLAYLATSSGTTGKTKCALIGREGLVDLMIHQGSYCTLGPADVVLQTSNPGFDAIISEVFVSLWMGSTIRVITTDDFKVISEIQKILKVSNIQLMTLTPSVASQIPAPLFQNLKTLILAGEKPSGHLLKLLLPFCNIINAYGPCEVTVCSHMHTITNSNQPSCVGFPIPSITAKVLDTHLKKIQIGEIGELWLYGSAVGCGYLGEKNTTFVYDEQSKKRGYKTGDFFRLNHDGSLDYEGREDNQYKIRGQKINLNTLNNEALKCPDVITTYSFIENKDIILAYQGKCAIEKIRQFLKLHLHRALIPKHIIYLEDIFLTDSGKLDIKVIKSIAHSKLKKQHPLNNPNQENMKLEHPGVDMFQSVLDVPQVNLKDNFFNIGGDSLKIAALMAKFFEYNKRELDLNIFLDNPTLEVFLNLFESHEKNSHGVFQLKKDMSYIKDNFSMTHLPKSIQPIQHVILTGSTGRVGFSILRSLLKFTNIHIICLGKGMKNRAREKICSQENSLGNNLERITWVTCDFSDKNSIQNALSSLKIHKNKLGIGIIHAAAYVNHIYDFDVLYQENVDATFQLLQFAYTNNILRFLYISSTSSAPILQCDPNEHSGYDFTKGASESLTFLAREKGLPTSILRLPLVYDLENFSAELQKKDHFLARTIQCLKMGTRPSNDNKTVGISAQDIGSIISEMILLPTLLRDNYDFLIDEGAFWPSLMEVLYTNTIQPIPYKLWRKMLFEHDLTDNALASFLSLYEQNGPLYQKSTPKVKHCKIAEFNFKQFLKMKKIDVLSSHNLLSTILKKISIKQITVKSIK